MELGVEIGELAKLCARLTNALHRRTVATIEGILSQGLRFSNFFCVAHAFEARFQGLKFAFFELECADFLALELGKFQAFHALFARFFELAFLTQGITPSAMLFTHLFGEFPRIGPTVDQRPLRIFAHKRQMLVLTHDLHHLADDLFKKEERRRYLVQPRTMPPLPRQHPPHNQRARRAHARFFELAGDARTHLAPWFKDARDAALLRAVSNRIRRSPTAE